MQKEFLGEKGSAQRKSRLIALVLVAAALVLGAASLLIRPTTGPTGTGTALIGGPFTMLNQNGETVTQKNFLGKYMLVFFGYTYCPDVCPATLQIVGKALDQLGPKAAQVTPVFVSIDPARDDVATMKNYVEAIDERLVGLTGTSQEVAEMAGVFRVFYAKVEDAKRPADYLMDHSSLLFLMAPDGSYLRHFNYDISSADLAAGLEEVIK
jgi:cytochrome oxidase Cu insertion factor (SCO1/SenC/PrrC family)